MASPVKAPAPVGAMPGVVPSAIPVALKSPMSPTAASPVREAKVRIMPRAVDFRGYQLILVYIFPSVFVKFSDFCWGKSLQHSGHILS